MANWLKEDWNEPIFGKVHKFTQQVSSSSFQGFRGIVFIQDGWGATDHIDLWNGYEMKAGEPEYFELGKQVWFWNLTNS